MNIYEGTENYIFVSYAHADSDKVLPIFEALTNDGVRLWCDKAIESGSEWPDLVATRLERSAGVIVFMTEKAISSRMVMNELNYSIQLKKNILIVYLEECSLSTGMSFQLSTYQVLHYHNYSNLSMFIAHLKTSALVKMCMDEADVSDSSEDSHAVPVKTAKNSKHDQIFISYRRKGGDVVAKLICSELQNRGYSVFYDYDSLKGGYFDDHIVDAIKNCKDFILVLPKRALARCRNKKDWVRQEIICALEEKKNIIPVMVGGFEFPNKLPPEISDVSRCNGVRFEMAYLDAVIDKIIEKFD